MPRIAISYRRADAAAITGRIFDRLIQRYGVGSVFMDIDEIPFGIDFRDHIREVLSTCDAVVIVIGQRWVGAEGDRRRIDEETDPVRVEVQAALDRGIAVIPVLVDGAPMPATSDLPEPIRALAFRNACPVDTGRDFHAHIDRLIRSIDRMFGEPAAAGTTAAPVVMASVPLSPAATAAPLRPGLPAASATGTQQPLNPVTLTLVIAFLALPQLIQFAQRKELFVLGLIVSTVGVATLLDQPERSILNRVASGFAVLFGLVIVQSALGIARASFLDW